MQRSHKHSFSRILFRRSNRSSRLSLRHVCRDRSFTVLALESSADDTCAAIVTSSREILSQVVYKQLDLNVLYGGIHPLYAVRSHQRWMPRAIEKVLADAHLSITEIDGIAFTRGPGMPGGLGVCSVAAKSLAAAIQKPIVGVHHMQAHALTPFLTASTTDVPRFPFLALLVSGGHTLLLLAMSNTAFKILATTADESIGRCIDKVSRMLKLDWSSMGPGAALERFCASAEAHDNTSDVVSMPSVTPGRLMFSFSGLHSIVERYITARGGIDKMDHARKLALAKSFQTAAFAQLEAKLALGLEWCSHEGIHIQHVVLSGGVASNAYLRARLQQSVRDAAPTKPISLIYPPAKLCTDNAPMIAWASMSRFLAQSYDDLDVSILPVWNIEDLSCEVSPVESSNLQS